MKKVIIPTVVALGLVSGVFMLSPAPESEKPTAPPEVACPPPPADHLREIARLVGVESSPDRKADDLAADIQVVLRESRPAVEAELSAEAEARAMKLLTKDEQQALRKALELARGVSGHRVLLLGERRESAQ